MTVICPKCKAENQLPDTLDRKTAYRCDVCKKRFAHISKTYFGWVAGLALMAWSAISALVWVAVFLERDDSVWSRELHLSFFPAGLSVAIGVTAIVLTAYFLWEGLRHGRFTGASPRGFRRFVLVSVLGFCMASAASGLAYGWWKWYG